MSVARMQSNRDIEDSNNYVTRSDIAKCPYCDALVWRSETTICCQQGRVKLPKVRTPPALLEQLQMESDIFQTNIRAYNAILAFTSMGAKTDHNIAMGNGPFCFRIHGQNYHRIGSLLPKPGLPPKFAHLYIYDTANEVRNRVQTLSRTEKAGALEESIVSAVIQILDSSNGLAKIFRKARDKYELGEVPEFSIRLIGQRNRGKEFDLPTTDETAGLIVGDMSSTIAERDIIVQLHTGHLQEISDLHPLFMSLQYPLLFPYGEIGFHEGIPYIGSNGNDIKRSFVTMREFYAYQIQTRLSEGMTIIKGGRLLHQYIVDAYTAIEQERLRFYRANKKKLRAELYNNVCDAVSREITIPKFLERKLYCHQASQVV